MRALEFITGHVLYNPTYTYKFQLKTTNMYEYLIAISKHFKFYLGNFLQPVVVRTSIEFEI